MTTFHRSKEWSSFARTWKPRIQADIDSGNARCINCGRAVQPGEAWDIGHQNPGAAYLIDAGWTFAELCDPSITGAAHRTCNRRDGQRIGVERRKASVAVDKRRSSW